MVEMPRRTAIVLVGGDIKEDLQAAKRLRAEASSATTTARRLLAYLREYIRGQPQVEDPDVLYEGFIGRISAGLARTTLKTYVDTMQRHQIHPRSLEAASTLIDRLELGSGIEREGRQEEIRGRVRGDQVDLRRLVWETLPGDKETDLEHRTLFFVALASGGRPDNILAAPKVYLGEGNLFVKWGRRKIRPPNRSALKYSLAWSFSPPADVQARIDDLETRPWLFKASKNIAAAMGAWLGRRATALGIGAHVTSTAGRAPMSTRLYAEYEAGRMTAERFMDLMDHEPRMARQRYCEGELD